MTLESLEVPLHPEMNPIIITIIPATTSFIFLFILIPPLNEWEKVDVSMYILLLERTDAQGIK